ncbi:MAG: hypothetical protein FWF51_00185 [Chitinivibrionia bacterium]|nr:hypothetical protein [Chitinivibrionia bacterium]
MSNQFDSIMENLQDTLEFAQGNNSKCRAVEVELKIKSKNKSAITRISTNAFPKVIA